MKLDPTVFHTAVRDVIKMNRLVNGGSPNPLTIMDQLRLQRDLIEEEVNEMYRAILQRDTLETVDGLCDTFVVWSYYHFLTEFTRGGIPDDDIDKWCEVFSDIEVEGHNCKTIIGTNVLTQYIDMGGEKVMPIDYSGVMSMLMGNVIEHYLGGKSFDLEANLRAVSASNWSKFPSVHSLGDPIEECRWIEDHYKTHKGQELEVEFKVRQDDDGVSRYIFLNKETGKFLKPSSFKGPELIV